MGNLRSLRSNRKRLKADFDAETRERWRATVAELDARIQLEVNRMKNDGATVAAIMREYGTSDRKTVTDLLFTQSEAPPTVLSSALTWEQIQGDTYSVTDGTNTAEFVVLGDEEALILVSTTDHDFGEGITFEHFRAVLEGSGSL